MNAELHPGRALRPVTRFRGPEQEAADDWLAEEVPVAVRYNGEPFAVMMATPDDLEDFAYGFSLSEGRVARPEDIHAVRVEERLEGIEPDIEAPAAAAVGADAARLLPGRSGCGLCGSRTLEDVVRRWPPVAAGPIVEATALERALAALGQRQPINAYTGAVHAAAWAALDGEIRLVREDVGRHNALDKLVGALWRSHADIRAGFLLVTSRASYEMVTKASSLGIGLIAAISAPTALAVHLARDSNMTLAGFVRPGRHVVYTHPERLRHAD